MDSCDFQTSFPYGGYTAEGYTDGEDNIVEEPGIGHEYCYNPPTTGTDTHTGFMNAQHHLPQHHDHQQHPHPVATSVALRTVRATPPVSSAAGTSVAQSTGSLIAHPDIIVPWSSSNPISSSSRYKYFSEYTDSHDIYPRPSTSPASDSSPSTSHSILPHPHYGNRQTYHQHPMSGTLLLPASSPCFNASDDTQHLIVGEPLRQSSRAITASIDRARNHSLSSSMHSIPQSGPYHHLIQHENPYYHPANSQPYPSSPRKRPSVTSLPPYPNPTAIKRHVRKLNQRLHTRSPPYSLPSPPLTTTPPSPKLSEVDCYTCRRRRVKCGRELPHCTKCDKAGHNCLGYTKPLVWNKGVASRGKMMGKSYGEEEVSKKTAAKVKREGVGEAKGERVETTWASSVMSEGTVASQGTVRGEGAVPWRGYEAGEEGYVVRWEDKSKDLYCT